MVREQQSGGSGQDFIHVVGSSSGQDHGASHGTGPIGALTAWTRQTHELFGSASMSKPRNDSILPSERHALDH